MIYFLRGLFKPLCGIALASFAISADAQVISVQQVIDQMESYKNFSYRSVNKMKELFATDTVTTQSHAVFERAPEEKNLGYLLALETKEGNDKFAYTDLYKGKELIHTNAVDSTYVLQSPQTMASTLQGTLPGRLKWLQGRLEKGLSKMVKASDTSIDARASYHLIVNVLDTVIINERSYTYADLYIDKLSGMPAGLRIRSRDASFGDGASTYYSESLYSDYQFNVPGIDIAGIRIPEGFHPPKAQPAAPKEETGLLAPGSFAPDWTLYTAGGQRTSLAQLKGKVVLMDFYFIGCFGCMRALKPLNNLYEKYKGKDVVIASLTARDSKQSVLQFEKNYRLKYPGYINAAEVVKAYHVDSFPTFYYIDKEGKIAGAHVGYNDNFEQQARAIIDQLNDQILH